MSTIVERPRPIDVEYARWTVSGDLAQRTGRELAIEPPLVGGRYRLASRIGVGRFGRVYRARDLSLNRDVAIKTVDPSGLSESRRLARINHPNVVTVYDHGIDNQTGFVVMELVEGQNLSDWRRDQPRPRHRMIEVFTDAARGLAAIHEAGLVHRDFKPDNVLVDKGGKALIADLGVAQASETQEPGASEFGGTPKYMAPEAFAGVTDELGDQFAWAIAFWESITGSDPFDASTVEARAASYLRGPTGPTPSGRLERILRRALDPDPGARWPSMEAVLDALAGERRAYYRRPVLVGVGVAAALALALGLLPSGPSTRVAVAEVHEQAVERTLDGLLAAALEEADNGDPSDAVTLLELAADRADTDEERVVVAHAADDVGYKLYSRSEWTSVIEAHSLAYDLFRTADSAEQAVVSLGAIHAAIEARKSSAHR